MGGTVAAGESAASPVAGGSACDSEGSDVAADAADALDRGSTREGPVEPTASLFSLWVTASPPAPMPAREIAVAMTSAIERLRLRGGVGARTGVPPCVHDATVEDAASVGAEIDAEGAMEGFETG